MDLLNGKTILIVDDEPDLRELLGEEFRFVGCQVLEASDGSEGIKVLMDRKVDIIISDVRMSDIDGPEFLEKVKEICPVRPLFFLLTGYPDIEAQVALKNGANGLFLKPINWKLLVSQIEEILQNEKK